MGITHLQALINKRAKLESIEERILKWAEKRDKVMADLKDLYAKIGDMDVATEIAKVQEMLDTEQKLKEAADEDADGDADEG
jgi:hypothetical protein